MHVCSAGFKTFKMKDPNEPAALCSRRQITRKCPDVRINVPWRMRLYVNLLTASASLFFLHATPPHHPHPPSVPPVCLASGSDTQYPHCVAVLQRGRDKRAHISNLCSALLLSLRTQRINPSHPSSTCCFIRGGQVLHWVWCLLVLYVTFGSWSNSCFCSVTCRKCECKFEHKIQG